METSPLICSAYQWTCFCLIGTSVMKELNDTLKTFFLPRGVFMVMSNICDVLLSAERQLALSKICPVCLTVAIRFLMLLFFYDDWNTLRLEGWNTLRLKAYKNGACSVELRILYSNLLIHL